MNGTVSSQLSEFSYQLSELQSLLINQNKVHAALQEIQKGLLLQDPELEYQRKNHRLKEMVEAWKSECELKERQVNEWKGEYTKCREEFNRHLNRMDIPKEVLHSHLHLKMDVEPITPPSSFAKLPVQDRHIHITKLEKLGVKIPVQNSSVSAKLEVNDSKLPIRDDNYAHKSEDPSVEQGRPVYRFVGPVVPLLPLKRVWPKRTLAHAHGQVHSPKKQYARKSTGQKPPVYSLFDLSSSDDSDEPVSYPTGRPRRSCRDRT